MGFSRDKLAQHLADYERAFGVKTEQFFCPLTRAFKETDLIDGHVFSKQFKCSQNIAVVQWGPIDNWCGSAYESHLLNYWNTARMTPEERVANAEFYVGISTASEAFAPDACEYRAFLRNSMAGRQMTAPNRKVDPWVVEMDTIAGRHEFVVQGITNANAPGSGFAYVFERQQFIPMMVSAAMMKAGFLTLFWLMGYECIKNPLVRLVGDRIKESFEANAREKSAHQFWFEFENAYALIEARRPGKNDEREPWHFDTMTSSSALELHRDGVQFAFVFVYDVDGITVQTTFPFTRRHEDANMAWLNYRAYLNQEFFVDQAVVSQWDGELWQSILTIPYVDQGTPMDHARPLTRGLRCRR